MDPLSITASILTLATVCVKSSSLLYQAIDGFNSSKKDVQQLKADIGDLNIVLQALERNIQESTENFEALRLILQQCSDACRDFHTAVLRALGEPENRVQGVKAWVRLQYHGNDIEGFRRLIGSYKATMTIALADANLRTSKATKELLEEYTKMTKITASNIEDQIDEFTAKLDLLRSEQQRTPSDVDSTAAAKQTLEQMTSLEQCLSVCQQLLVHIEGIKASILEPAGGNIGTENMREVVEEATMLGPRITANALEMCSQGLKATETHLRDLHEGSQSKSKSDQARALQQLGSAQQCLDIIKEAQQQRYNVFEKIDTAEDSSQIIVSTIGDLIKATGLTIGARAVNIMGQMNDDSLQKIVNSYPSSTPPNRPPPDSSVKFEQRYGYGKTAQQGMP